MGIICICHNKAGPLNLDIFLNKLQPEIFMFLLEENGGILNFQIKIKNISYNDIPWQKTAKKWMKQLAAEQWEQIKLSC